MAQSAGSMMSGGSAPVAIPLRARLILARAAVQVIAADNGVDLIHIKGDVIDAALRDPTAPGASGTDVDVMVRPAHIGLMDRALHRSGWTVYSTFANGSPFAHAQTYRHDTWGYLDMHRSFPGFEIDDSAAFQLIWRDASTVPVAGVGCRVPSLAAQALILILNSARSGSRTGDVARAWDHADPGLRAATTDLAATFRAEVAFAAATGRLDEYRDHPSYRLWRAVSQGGSRSEEWVGRVLAARNPRDRARLIARLPLVNIEHLEIRLGRPPTPLDVVAEFFARPARAVREWLNSRRTGRDS